MPKRSMSIKMWLVVNTVAQGVCLIGFSIFFFCPGMVRDMGDTEGCKVWSLGLRGVIGLKAIGYGQKNRFSRFGRPGVLGRRWLDLSKLAFAQPMGVGIIGGLCSAVTMFVGEREIKMILILSYQHTEVFTDINISSTSSYSTPSFPADVDWDLVTGLG